MILYLIFVFFFLNKFLVGVLTKLDLVDRGAEQKLLEVFENKRIPLKLGYLMVKCRTQEDIDNNIELSMFIKKTTTKFY
jgi:interferon-induced GTP-binding protein Mx1